MAWSNQGGNGGGGGPWKPGTPGPWGQGPNRPGGGPSPDLEEFLRRSQERMRRLMPNGSPGLLGVLAAVLLIAVVWLASGFYEIGPNQVGINRVFGAYTGKTEPGLNYNWPFPIGRVDKLPVTDRNSIDIGSSASDDLRRTGFQATAVEVPEDSLMLTGDQDIADVKFRVIWQIDPLHPENYAFKLHNPDDTIRAVAESAMREVIGRFDLQGILTSNRSKVEQNAQELIQATLKNYEAGVLIVATQLLSVGPPAQVIGAYRDVTAAQQDQQRQVNEAEAYRNRVVPEARGAAAGIQQEAQAYREQTVQEAKGQAYRFEQVYEQYRNAPDVTRQRLYIETMENVLSGTDKVILDGKGGVVPYLPLGGLPQAPSALKGASQ